MLLAQGETVPSVIRDHPEWHRGRRRYALWLIRLEREEVRSQVTAAREHLSGFLQGSYRRQPHITVFVCGFPAEAPRHDDDFSAVQLRCHEEALRSADIRPFSLEIGGLNSFSSAPFLEVADRERGIERIRSVLARAGREIGRGTERFVPHVTIGLYAGVYPGRLVLGRLADFRSDPVTVSVGGITFATYAAEETAGPLTCLKEIAFRPR